MLGSFSLCQFDAFLTYQLGVPKAAGVGAAKGNAAHKGLELLARRKHAEQKGETTVVDEEVGREFRLHELTPGTVPRIGFDLYAKKNPELEMGPAEFREVQRHIETVVNSMFNPLKLDIVQPEQFFDLVIDEPWAHYDFEDPHTGARVAGHLAVRGAMDLLFRNGPMLCYCDYKTGARLNWKTREEKTVDDLHHDEQLLLYYYAIRRLYPDEPAVEMTIFYTKSGGPFTLYYDDESFAAAKRMIQRRFEEITRTGLPSRVADDRSIPRFKKPCTFCHYAKAKWPGKRESICDYLHGEAVQLGVDRVTKKYGRPNVWGTYGSGGGQTRNVPREES